jgi:hypothetical protein
VLPDAWGARQCDEVKAMAVLGNDCPRLFALTRIHDVVPVFDGQNLLSQVGILRDPK